MATPAFLQLALGACVVSEAGRYFLRHSRGVAALNRLAAVTLKLCDGRNTRSDVIAHMACHPFGERREREVSAFLDSACELGWITEVRTRLNS